MQETFVGRLRGACAVLPGSHVLVAVSGGADSTALLCFFCEIRETYPISVSCAHVEHGIRGAASEEDMRFVKALCEQKNVPFYGGRVDAPGYARAHGCGLEEAARALRYDFLEKTAEAVGADAIALAHHRGDQAETVLLHAARGSDIRGLCAMRWRRGKLIRPLLDAEPEVAICVENVLDDDPASLMDLADAVDDPRLGLCLDVGHANAVSKIPVRQWLKRLAPRLMHLHLHDNDGAADLHQIPGDGSLGFPGLMDEIEAAAPEATLTFECMDGAGCARRLAEYGWLER